MSETNNSPQTAAIDTNQIIEERRAKLSKLREAGNAFPNDFERKDLAQEMHDKYGELDKEGLEEIQASATVAGRIMLKRVMGKASFATIQDMSGQIQLYINNEGIGEEEHAAFKHWDLGDIIGASGVLFKTKTGELSLRVSDLRLLTKSLRPLPEKFHGLTDQEQRFRQRYVDLIVTPEARKNFQTRSKAIQILRTFFTDRGYLEVETPMMQSIPGGATAKPFITHHNALDMQLYLRVAPELYLKRLVVGGFEKVFEINRNFRNEGISTRHNPEFTMLEFYEAYRDYRYLMDLTETMLRELAEACTGSSQITYQGQEIDFAKPFQRLTMAEAIYTHNKIYTRENLQDPEFLRQELTKRKVLTYPTDGLGMLQLKLFEDTTEEKLIEPTFIVAHPTDVSPLARSNDEQPELTDRFELFIAGREIANGFSELNDPEDQANRFKNQAEAKAQGDDEAMFYDSDYIRALEYGMPPTAGEGIGIDRLIMLLTDSASIREVILFPQMRSE
ncbi:MAG: lysine--tRNA ligase [Burkholderiales bacterium]|jgi:lysyl-tRNA synthetase class 2